MSRVITMEAAHGVKAIVYINGVEKKNERRTSRKKLKSGLSDSLFFLIFRVERKEQTIMNALEEACKAIDLLRAEKMKLEEENARLKKQNQELRKRVSDAGWQYEYDHADDWRKVHEMGSL